MAFTFDDSSRGGVPLSYGFSYGGSPITWGTYLMRMSPVTMKAEPFDGDFTVSALTTSFSDTDGNVWANLGNGLTCLGSSWSATVYVGGQMEEQAYGGSEVRLARTSLGSAGTFLIHTGQITQVSRSNRVVTIVSKNNMAKVKDLEWRFPVAISPGSWDYFTPGNVFYNGSYIGHTDTGGYHNHDKAFFDVSEDRTGFKVYTFTGTIQGTTLDDVYPTPPGRGTMGLEGTNFAFMGTQFYSDYDRVLFKGSYLGVFTGTIDSEEKAYDFGYMTKDAAELSKTGGSYVINKTRLAYPGGTLSFPKGSALYFQQAVFTLEDTPADLWKEMLTGCCVTPIFGTADIDANTFATALNNTAFQTFRQTIDPTGGEVLPYIKNALETLGATWSVSSSNTFRLSTYGPRNFSDVVGSLDASEIIESSVEVDDESMVNKIILEFGYSSDTGSFHKRTEVVGSSWSPTHDYTKVFQNKWLDNPNDAGITCQRILSRYERPIPRMTLKIPLSRLTADVGSLYTVTDVDTDYSAHMFEIVGWSKDFTEDRSEELELLDADAVYRTGGYARWEGDASLTQVVSGTSLSGWSDGGTVNNINEAIYGSVFLWS